MKLFFKTAACVFAFLTATAFFAFACRELLNNYLLAFAPSAEQTVPWLTWLAASILLFLLAFSAMVVLVAPAVIAAAAYAAAAATYGVLLGGGNAVWAASAAAAVVLIMADFSVRKQVENQIDFSSRPVGEKALAVSSILAVLIAVPAGLGYVQDAERGKYLIPPQLTGYVREKADAYVQTLVAEQKLPAAVRGVALNAAKEQIGAVLNELEKQAEPYAEYIPYALGAMAYFTFHVALFVPGFLAGALVGPMFGLLKLVRFAHVLKEKREVTRLSLLAPEAAEARKQGGDPWKGGV
jgi:hypothetical protein